MSVACVLEFCLGFYLTVVRICFLCIDSVSCFCGFCLLFFKVIYHFYIFCSFSSKYKINPLLPLSSLPDFGFSLDKLLHFPLGSFFHLLQADVSEHRYYHLLLWSLFFVLGLWVFCGGAGRRGQRGACTDSLTVL